MFFRRVAPLAAAFVVLSSSQAPSIAAPSKKPPAKKDAVAAVAEATVPPEAAKLIDEAIAKGKAQKFTEAVDLLQQALALLEKKLGKDHYLLGNTLNLLAQIEIIQGHLDAAEKHAERSIGVLKKDVNADPLRLGHALIRRAEIYGQRGDRDHEIEYRKLTITLYEKAFGAEGIDAMAQVPALATALTKWGLYAEAKPYYERWVNVIERKYGADEPVLVDILLSWANNEMYAGRYAQAEALLERALDIRKKQGLTRDEDVAEILNNLAEVHYQRGDYLKAEGLYTRVFAVFEKTSEPHDKALGIIMGNLGSVRLDLGRVDDALALLRKSLEIQEAYFGPKDAALVTPLTNLGEALLRTDHLSECIPYLERALALREKALGTNHPRLVTPLINLGSARLDEGKLPEAEKYLLRALDIQEKTVGPDHPLTFQIHQALGMLEQKRKNYVRAEERHNRALEVLENSFGPTHPDLVAPLKSLAVLLTLRKDFAGARKILDRAGSIAEKHTKLLLAVGSESQKLAWLQTIEPVWSLTVEHHIRREPTNPEAAKMALEATWRRKGRALDAMASTMSAFRRQVSGEDKAVLDELRDKQQKYAAMMVSSIPAGEDTAKWIETVRMLDRDIDRLNEQLNKRSVGHWAERTPATVANMQAMLPKDGAYVEFIRHQMGWALLPGEQAKSQYTAYVLRPEGEPQAVALGSPGDIDAAVASWREALAEPSRKDVKSLSRALEEKVMRPLHSLLLSARQLIVAPDGALDFIPFEALLDEQGHYWVEKLSISYVTSGREVFRWPQRVPSRSGPVIVANPDFGEIKKGSASTARSANGVSRLGFGPLPGTAEEGKAIAKQLPGSTLHLAKDANKAAVTSVAGPKMLHIATHGFFMDESSSSSAEGTRGFTLEGEPPAPQARAVATSAVPAASPMLLSGVALSGANERGKTSREGILTALEASGLDLDGTKLVVLSACETGLGGVSQSEGVMGLRRAFVLAGAETTVMSLWKVDDGATRDMMIGYYQRIEAGGGRSEALREVRLNMLANEATAHPFYWASFIVSGDPSRFDGTMPAVPQVAPGARGCACIVAGDLRQEDAYGAVLLFMAGGMIGFGRRRRLS